MVRRIDYGRMVLACTGSPRAGPSEFRAFEASFSDRRSELAPFYNDSEIKKSKKIGIWRQKHAIFNL